MITIIIIMMVMMMEITSFIHYYYYCNYKSYALRNRVERDITASDALWFGMKLKNGNRE